jgi:phosphinothricin acetyltransferase
MEERHRQPVIDLFNDYIRHSHAAFISELVDYQFFDYLLNLARVYPAVAVRSAEQQVVGFAFLRPHHGGDAFRRTAEITSFIQAEHTRRGLGTAILEVFEEQARRLGIDCLLACVSSKNPESLKFHRKNGFRECGRFLKVGRKFGEDFDTVWLQKRLGQRE